MLFPLMHVFSSDICFNSLIKIGFFLCLKFGHKYECVYVCMHVCVFGMVISTSKCDIVSLCVKNNASK